MSTTTTYTVRVHDERAQTPDAALWAEVEELPGVFATGADLLEVFETLGEAVALVVLDVPALEAALDAKGER